MVAKLTGTMALATYSGSPPEAAQAGDPAPFEQTLELELQGDRYVIVGSRGEAPGAAGRGASERCRASAASGWSTSPGMSASTSATAPFASRPRRTRWR